VTKCRKLISKSHQIVAALRQIVREVIGADGTTQYAAVWPDKNTITNLGTLPGDFGSLRGINHQGVAVAGTWLELQPLPCLIYRNGMMTGTP
jgi:hypothetical protein